VKILKFSKINQGTYLEQKMPFFKVPTLQNFQTAFLDFLCFVNEVNAKSGLKERDFIENIKNFELQNPNYKIFLLIIKDNTFFDLPLEDKEDYLTSYRNEIKKN